MEPVICKCGADLRAVPFAELQLHDTCEAKSTLPVEVVHLGVLATQCELKAQNARLFPWERASLINQARRYRQAQGEALEAYVR